MPEDLIAINSDFSERLPIVIIDDNRTDKGRPIGTNVHEAYKSNSKIKFVSSPFPIKSSMYFHKNCINKIKITMEKV